MTKPLSPETKDWRAKQRAKESRRKTSHAILDAFPLHTHDKFCGNCRYYREHANPARSAECLFLGRTLAINDDSPLGREILHMQSFYRYCDGWRKRPRGMSKYADENPHWHDRYYSRKSIHRIRLKRLRELAPTEQKAK